MNDVDPMTTETARMFLDQRDAALAELAELQEGFALYVETSRRKAAEFGDRCRSAEERVRRLERERRTLLDALVLHSARVEEDRREPDKILCHAAGMRRAVLDIVAAEPAGDATGGTT